MRQAKAGEEVIWAGGSHELPHGLVAQGVTKRFGGLVALSDVSLALCRGQIHGLIGPNGSGKTTLLNMLCGYYAPDAGEIRCGATALTRLSVEDRVAYRIARTFQTPRLLGDLTVLDNVMVGGWRNRQAGFLETALALPRALREERAIRRHAQEILRGLGLADMGQRRADTLEHGEQRFLEIARALAMRPDFLLLDEPAGGLTDEEIRDLESVIRAVRDSGVGVLLVEHHTDFVFRTCEEVTVLDLGQVLARGEPQDVRSHPDVIRVYLGAGDECTEAG